VKKVIYFLLLIPTALIFLLFGLSLFTFLISWFFSGFFDFTDPFVFGSPNIYFGGLIRFIPTAICFKGMTFFWEKIKE